MIMTVEQIENAIKVLPKNELSELSTWFEEFEATVWDEQIAEDVESGKLQALINEADAEFEAGECKPL